METSMEFHGKFNGIPLNFPWNSMGKCDEEKSVKCL
jgi:hypothetical protein